MNFKIDTKEKFCVIRISETIVTDIVAESLTIECNKILNSEIKNTIIDCEAITSFSENFLHQIAAINNDFRTQNVSFVLFGLKKELIQQLKTADEDMFETLNITPTESEAWDIVQMEEIEREYLD